MCVLTLCEAGGIHVLSAGGASPVWVLLIDSLSRVSDSAGVPRRRLPSQCPHLDLLERFYSPFSVYDIQGLGRTARK